MHGDPHNSPRNYVRKSRAALTQAQIRKNSKDLLNSLRGIPEFTSAKRLSGYIAVKGEMDPDSALTHARSLGITTYLPIVRGKYLEFAPYSEKTRLLTGKFNIPVPEYSETSLIRPQQLDAVLAPLVAFDPLLNRMGMGGGFYDRSFEFRANNLHKPVLIGIAHEFQKVATLDAQPWDIPMDIIVTEKAVYRRPEADTIL